MSTITINNPTTPVEQPSPVAAQNISIEGNGNVGAETHEFTQNGNVPATLNWNISNIQNASFVKTSVWLNQARLDGSESGSTTVDSGTTVKVVFVLNVPVGDPGETMPAATADYAVQWA